MDFTLTAALEGKLAPTHKLFVDDPYAQTARARIMYAQGPYVILDQTLFYAESGGQQSDGGTLGGVAVIDVQKKGGRRLVVRHAETDVPAVTVDTLFVHQLACDAPFAIGDEVDLALDWSRRYQTMRYHAAAHFVFQAAHQVYDTPDDVLYIKGCHIDHEGARFDFFGSLESERLGDVEALANDWIAKGEAILMEKEPQTSDIRYWRSGSIIIPCGGTHVASATELGPIKLKRSKKGATTTRLSLVFAQ